MTAKALLPYISPSALTYRCISEIKRGNPVILQHSGAACLFIALDTLSAAGWRQLSAQFSADWRLVISQHRLSSLQQQPLPPHTSNQAVVLPLPTCSYQQLRQLLSLDALPTTTCISPNTLPVDIAEKTALALLRQAGLMPVGISQFLLAESIPSYTGKHHILSFSLDQLQPIGSANKEVDFVVETLLPLTAAEESRIILFREKGAETEHMAVIIGNPDFTQPTLTRIHSSCLTGDVLGSLRCDCGSQLQQSIEYMAKHGGGVLIYLLQEGRNIGLANKLRSYHLQNQGLDTLTANWHLGFSADERSFELATILLKHLGISSIQLLSNNPLKSQALQAGGIKIDRMVPMLGRRNAFNQDYLKTKKQKMGHHLS